MGWGRMGRVPRLQSLKSRRSQGEISARGMRRDGASKCHACHEVIPAAMVLRLQSVVGRIAMRPSAADQEYFSSHTLCPYSHSRGPHKYHEPREPVQRTRVSGVPERLTLGHLGTWTLEHWLRMKGKSPSFGFHTQLPHAMILYTTRYIIDLVGELKSSIVWVSGSLSSRRPCH